MSRLYSEAPYYVWGLFDMHTGKPYYIGLREGDPYSVRKANGYLPLHKHQGGPLAKQRTAIIRRRQRQNMPQVRVLYGPTTYHAAVTHCNRLLDKHATTVVNKRRHRPL